VAELRVERKRPHIWRWIVLLLLIALLVWAIVELFGGEDSTVIEDSPAGAMAAPSTPAQQVSP
jgi:hypothetical protein